MTFCEQTDFNEYAIHLNSEELDALQKNLAGTMEPKLFNVLKAIHAEKYPVNKAGFERIRNIKLCHKCDGRGRIRIVSLLSMDIDYDDCPFCSGDGNVIRKTTVTWERMTTCLRNDFAK